MAEVNVENMEENAELFVEKMGFSHDSEGLEMSDDQLVNFLLLCHQMQFGISDEYEEEMMEMPEDSDVKVKIMKVGSGDDVHSMMNKILGGQMPVRKVKGGYRYGTKGKTYKTKAEAERQGRAIRASGYKKKK